LNSAPPGRLIEADGYYAFSSVFFYTNRTALLWNGRKENLEYGSYAPDAAQVFIDDQKLEQLWCGNERYYLLSEDQDMQKLKSLVGDSMVHVVLESGGKFLLTNQDLPSVSSL
jgi:hypothetical protein